MIAIDVRCEGAALVIKTMNDTPKIFKRRLA